MKSIINTIINYVFKLKTNETPNTNDWWINGKCTTCYALLTQKAYSYCGHCRRTLCKNCGYIPGGCGWCGG
jgi:hypothetical protein